MDVNSFLRFGEDIQREIDLIKGWRKSDNKFKGAISATAANFANVNNNGNANNSNASNSKAKKLVLILSEKDFDDWFRSWFNGHCHYMSKLQRSNMLDLCKKLKEEHYYGKTDFS